MAYSGDATHAASTSNVVIVTVAFFGLFFFLVDSAFGYLIQRVLAYFKH